MAWLLVAIGAAAQNSAPRMTKASAEVRPKTTFNCTLPQELVPPKEQSSEDALPALSNLLLTNVILPRRKKGDHSYTLFAELLSKHFGDPPCLLHEQSPPHASCPFRSIITLTQC